MSTIIIENGFEISIYRDHLPPHVHLRKAGEEVRIRLDTIEIYRQPYMNKKDLKNALSLVAKYKKDLTKKWREING